MPVDFADIEMQLQEDDGNDGMKITLTLDTQKKRDRRHQRGWFWLALREFLISLGFVAAPSILLYAMLLRKA